MSNALISDHFSIIDDFAAFFADLFSIFESHIDSLKIHLQPVYHANKDDFVEVKFSWVEFPNLDKQYGEFFLLFNKLKLFTNVFLDLDFFNFIEDLEQFNHHFFEFQSPWNNLDWRCFYIISTDRLHYLDNRKTVIETIKLSDSSQFLEILSEKVNERLKKQFLKKLNFEIKRIQSKLNNLRPLLEFNNILKELANQSASDLLAGLKLQYEELISIQDLNQAQTAILALSIRLSIETLINRSYSNFFNHNSNVALGSKFGKLQSKNIFLKEKALIEENLIFLNKPIHGEETYSKEEIISAKEVFKSILGNYGLVLPF